MKKFITITMTTIAAMMLFACSAFALTDGDWEFQLLDNEVQITGYLGNDTELVIPDTIYGAPVTQIKSYGIMDNEVKRELTSVKFPKNVKYIPDATFDECPKVTEFILPEGAEVIGKYAFRGCSALESIKLPETLKVISISAFEHCTSLKTINFPASLERIDAMHAYQTFSGTAIEHVDLSKTTAQLGEAVFKNCKNLKTVKLNSDMKSIPKWMFDGCESLESVEIPGGVTEIGGYAFAGCKSLKNIILPVSLKKINDFAAFASCEALEEVVIPYGTTNIGGNAFENCKNLKSVYIPDTVKAIGILNIVNGCPNAIIYCGAGSKTAEHCKKNSISYLTDNSVNSGITVLYNGTRISFHAYGQNPELLNSRTLVPLRSIFEAMGADVDWNPETRTAIAKRDGIEVKIQIGANEMYKNNRSISVDVPATILNDRTMVPARVIAEAFGADVQWNDNGKTVLINE